MLKHALIDRICAFVTACTLILALTFAALVSQGVVPGKSEMGYESRLFDSDRVHTIDIQMADWEGFLKTASQEEYALCTLVVDGETFQNAGIRGKGNTSLSNVSAYGNDRYSFKVEFDHYDDALTYYGLDKLSLNNLIQDKTWMKDYLSYTLMGKMGVASPLCSYVQISVNGEFWGLYLAVEGVEDAFLQRNYGAAHGELYKPDSMSFGGGRGNGRDFDMDDFREQWEERAQEMPAEEPPQDAEGFDFSQMQPGAFDPFSGQVNGENGSFPRGGGRGFDGKGMNGGMGSNDVKLQYIDDDPNSYSNIFSNAKTTVTAEDQERLIAALKTLSGENASSAVDAEQVICYLAVHHFLCNDDSYTGQMIHNYYLYEENGVLAMIPWDYNLAFGGFSMGMNSAQASVNAPIDSPVSSGDISDRPMVRWVFESEAYVQQYHEIYQELVDQYLESGWLLGEIDRIKAMIAPYVQQDPTAFYSYEEFEKGVEALRTFCTLRTQSVSGQLKGIVPSTADAQRQNTGALIDTGELDLSDLGEFNQGGGKEMPGGMPMPDFGAMEIPEGMERPGGGGFPGAMEMPNGMGMPGSMPMPGSGMH